MNDVDRALAALAAEQRHVFTREQAIASGLTRAGLWRRLASGLFVPVGPRTLTFAGVVLDWRGRLKAGLLDLGPGALVSAEAAAPLHEFDGFDEGPLVFLVPRHLRKRATVGEVISTSSIEPLDQCVVDDLEVVSGTRAVIELIGRVSPTRLANAYDSAVRRRLTAPTVIDRRLHELGRRGRTGIADLDDVVAMAGVETWLERRFLRLVTRSGLTSPAIQRVYRRDGVHVARVDFDFAPLPVVVEVGGRRGYMSAAERQRKERRRNQLQLLGRLIYFFTTEDVRDDPEYVLSTLRQALGRRAG